MSAIEAVIPTLARKDEVATKDDLARFATKDDIARVEGEQRQIKERLGDMPLREIGRLDGRIDQLTMSFDLFRKQAAG